MIAAESSSNSLVSEGMASRQHLERNPSPSQSLLSSRKNVGGMRRDTGYLILASIVLSLPLVAISITLLIMLFHYSVRHNQIVPSEFQAGVEADESGVYYTTISSTSFVLVTSYSSTFATLTIGLFMSLLSYPIAQRFLKDSTARSVRQLPTPYQLGLLIGCLNGNTITLWRWLKYSWTRFPKKRINAMQHVAYIFLIVNVIAYPAYVTASNPSLLILGVDTWLHYATKTVQFQQTSLPESMHTFGRGLSEYCLSLPNTSTSGGTSLAPSPFASEMFIPNPLPPCSVVNASGSGIVGADEAFNTVHNLSSTNQLMTAINNSTTYVFLGDAQAPDNIGFTASSIAVNVNCSSILDQCVDPSDLSTFSYPFNCTGGAFSGNLISSGSNFYMDYFNDSSLTQKQDDYARYPSNPFYIGLAAQYPTSTQSGGVGTLILSCEVMVYNANYTWLNNGVHRFGPLSLANASMAGILAAPESALFAAEPISFVQEKLSLLRFVTESQELYDKISVILGQMSLGYAVGVFSPRTNFAEIVQESFLVSRIPAIPVYILLALNGLYVCVAISVVAAALFLSRSQDVREVQSRLSVMGVLAQIFETVELDGRAEKVEGLFEELRDGDGSAAVLIDRENGWRYCKS